MSSDDVDLSKRRLLVGATTVVGGVGAGFTAVPFVASWMPSEKAAAAGAPVEVDIASMAEGELKIVEWRGKPVWIVRRTKAMLETLAQVVDDLRDPASAESEQPTYTENEARSIKPEFMVMLGICTHLGCSPTFRPDIAPADLGDDWMGGFLCPCHGGKYDLAGRVYKSVPPPLNLPIPPYRYLSDTRILIGEDEGVA